MLVPSSARGGGTNLRLLLLHRAIGQLVERLLDDAQRLAHLFHAHQVAGVNIPISLGGDVELILLVAGVGLGFAQVMGHPRGAQRLAR